MCLVNITLSQESLAEVPEAKLNFPKSKKEQDRAGSIFLNS